MTGGGCERRIAPAEGRDAGGRGSRQHPRPPHLLASRRFARFHAKSPPPSSSNIRKNVGKSLPLVSGHREHASEKSFYTGSSQAWPEELLSPAQATAQVDMLSTQGNMRSHKPNHARRGLTTPNAGRRALSEGRHTFSAGRRAPTQADTPQRGPTRVQRGPRNVYKEGFSRFAARIACFPKVSFGTDQQIPIGPKATTLSPGIIFSAFVSACERAPAPRQPNGKDLENSHFETRSADFLPKARDRTPRRLSPEEPGVTHPERRHDRSRIAAATHPKKRRCASSPHLRNRRRRRAQRRALRLPALRIGVKNGDRVDAVAPEGYGSRT